MTNTPTDMATGVAVAQQPVPSVAKVLAALHRLGEATAAAIATEAGLGYSTTTPKLRNLETAGLAEPTRSDTGRSLWRLTDTGRTQAQQSDDHGQPGPKASTCDAATPDTAAQHDPRGDAAQETGEVTGQGHGVEAASDEAAEPEGPVANDSPDLAAGAPTADQPAAGPAEPDAGTADDDTTGNLAAEGSPATPPANEGAGGAPEAGTRRASGTLRGAILDILEANPGRRYKVSELCKLIDRANEGTDAKKASAGAVHNAAVKLVGTGRAVLAAEKPVTFALADPTA